MEENTTSVLIKAPAENITLEDVLYLIQGVGADRDRKATLGQLFESGVLSRIDCKTVELTASTSVSVSKDYTLILVDNNQNSGAILTATTSGTTPLPVGLGNNVACLPRTYLVSTLSGPSFNFSSFKNRVIALGRM